MLNKNKKFKGGVILPHTKQMSQSPTQNMPVPEYVEIPMQQHIGAPCEVMVKKGDMIKVGQLVGDSSAYVSAPIHSGVSGEVTAIKEITLHNGAKCTSVVIKTDGTQTICDTLSKPDISTKENFLKAVRASGLTGLGGAGFPVHVKLNTKDRIPECLIVNASECEPYITCDHQAALEEGDSIFKGIQLILDKLSIQKAMIGFEDDKADAAQHMKQICAPDNRISVKLLKTKYPQGGEKSLIYALTGRKVPMGGLPLDIGVIVMNLTTVLMLNKYCETGMPLTSRRITIGGNGVSEKGNFNIIFGTYIKDIFEYCTQPGQDVDAVKKILYGGPMNGLAVRDIEIPVIKQNNAILFMTESELDFAQESACIRCGRCVDKCPMGLMPLMLNRYALQKNTQELENFFISNCNECGVCSYVCPAKRHLVQSIKLGKELIRKERSKNG